MLRGARPMTDDAVRYLHSGDGQVEFRVVGSGPSAARVPENIACAATIVTVHEFRRVGRTPWSRLGASAIVMRSK
jgi:hypothetical protein